MTSTTSSGKAAAVDGAPVRREPRDAAHELLERCWRVKDVTVLNEMADPECTYTLPGHPQLDNKQFLDLMQQIWRAKPDLRIDLLDMIVEGEWVASRVRFSGTQTGELLGIPPTGRFVSIDEMILERWDEQGRLLEFHQEADFVGMLTQLGVVPPKEAGPLGQLAHTFTSAARFTWLKRKARRNSGR
ncbi:ester cyclase [Streptomyces sp. NPDC051207]|uniref:ester cyclase n=1 Tax=Streptomyces sp. NPDC051207 TaxID=3154641 RepID=UPI0034378F79